MSCDNLPVYIFILLITAMVSLVILSVGMVLDTVKNWRQP